MFTIFYFISLHLTQTFLKSFCRVLRAAWWSCRHLGSWTRSRRRAKTTDRRFEGRTDGASCEERAATRWAGELALLPLEACWAVGSFAVGASRNDLGHNKERAGDFELVCVLIYEIYFQLGKLYGKDFE